MSTNEKSPTPPVSENPPAAPPVVKPEPVVHRVSILLCELCLEGKGDECHTPGCALFLHNSPGHPIHKEFYEIQPEPSDTEMQHVSSEDLERLRLAVKKYGEVNNALHEIAQWCFDLTLTCMTTDGVSHDIRLRARAAHNIMLKYRHQYDLRSRAEVETGHYDAAINSPNYKAFAPAAMKGHSHE